MSVNISLSTRREPSELLNTNVLDYTQNFWRTIPWHDFHLKHFKWLVRSDGEKLKAASDLCSCWSFEVLLNDFLPFTLNVNLFMFFSNYISSRHILLCFQNPAKMPGSLKMHAKRISWHFSVIQVYKWRNVAR